MAAVETLILRVDELTRAVRALETKLAQQFSAVPVGTNAPPLPSWRAEMPSYGPWGG